MLRTVELNFCRMNRAVWVVPCSWGTTAPPYCPPLLSQSLTEASRFYHAGMAMNQQREHPSGQRRAFSLRFCPAAPWLRDMGCHEVPPPAHRSHAKLCRDSRRRLLMGDIPGACPNRPRCGRPPQSLLPS